MGWKIFFGLLALLYVYGLKDLANPSSLHVMQWVALPIDAVVLLGLFGYAFRREFLTALFWRMFAAVYVVVQGLSFTVVVQASAEQGAGAAVLIGALAIMLLFSVPILAALLLYAARLSKTEQAIPAT